MDEVNTVLERMKARCDSRGYRGSWPRNRPEEAAYGIMMDTRERIMSLEANDPSAEGGQYRSTYLQVAKAHQELLHTLQGFHTRSRPAGVQTGTEATTPLLEITEELGDLPNDIEFSFNAPPSSRREYPPRNLWSRQESGDQSPCCGGASSSAGLSVITATTEDQYEGVAEASVANALVADLLANTMSTLTPIDENIQDRSTSDGVEALSEEGTILNGEGASNIKTRGVQGISESPHEYDNEDSTQPPEGGVAGGTPVSEEGLRLKELGRGRTREDVEGASARGGGITTGEEDDHLLNGCLMAVGGGDEPREDNHFDEGGMMRGFDHDREIALAVLAEHYDRIDKARPVGEDQIGDGVAMTIGEYHPDTVLFEAEDRVNPSVMGIDSASQRINKHWILLKAQWIPKASKPSLLRRP
ncbi:hypothetical protein Pmar_PMAR007224 [Perkinsus marinus ATCC 50983]|uniref:Uncharacterized protein n=1 Tax=Perkinsus marinus (strain ATCC 50983 / TXsc) TaxID=423536 RepID=C5LWQ0_PERM5|nr:hypothetical protein Pmar_PMAR007224 [Perkinsus marinus ATCC 50983]EEQ98845.1 hypothetical protein Pmar_PMAR007224 [Perkinsus marinus ATCC 50983]|eukprot:XP_002766128.1 hypothetical protein Pmar_PMAR007224 [Perkinsus marinus ATCC 50983]